MVQGRRLSGGAQDWPKVCDLPSIRGRGAIRVRRYSFVFGRPPQLAASFISNQADDVADWHEPADPSSPLIGRFSNRPFGVKRFQTIHHSGARASLRNRHRGPSIMGFEDEAEQSIGRPCRQTNGRSKRPNELTSTAQWSSSFLLLHLIL